MTEQNKKYTANNLLNMDPLELVDFLAKRCKVNIPLSINTQEEGMLASKELAKASAYYAYLSPMKMRANVLKRKLKVAGADKILIEDMLSRETIFESQMNVMKQCYETISRLFTIKHKDLEELKLLQEK